MARRLDTDDYYNDGYNLENRSRIRFVRTRSGGHRTDRRENVMASINVIRLVVSQVYPHKKWKDKVAKMTDNQVTAIYMSLKARGKI